MIGTKKNLLERILTVQAWFTAVSEHSLVAIIYVHFPSRPNFMDESSDVLMLCFYQRRGDEGLFSQKDTHFK